MTGQESGRSFSLKGVLSVANGAPIRRVCSGSIRLCSSRRSVWDAAHAFRYVPRGLHSISAEGEHRIDRSKDCLGCHKCTEACLYSALEVAGEQCSISELLEYVEEDRAFYEQSGGGVTLGGGEVTSQPEAAINLLMACKQEGFHTAIETCGYTKKDTILKFAEFVDLFLFDIKHIDPDRHFYTYIY